jgi:serine/threonine protein kinase
MTCEVRAKSRAIQTRSKDSRFLHHPNIVNMMDFGLASATSQTVAYLVMEYLEGRTLWVSEK